MFDGLFATGFEISPYLYNTKSEVEWRIPVSEVEFDDVKSRGKGINLAYSRKLNESWVFLVDFTVNREAVRTGTMLDTDSAGDAILQKTQSDMSGEDYTEDMLATGFKYRWLGNKNHYLGILVGMSESEREYKFTNGAILIPNPQQPFAGLNSSYETAIDSVYASFFTEHVFRFGTLGFRYDRHNVNFDAKANWNLRDDLAHPVSFAHTGEGDSEDFTFGYTYTINKHFDVFYTFSVSKTNVENGYDQSFLSTGETAIQELEKFEMKDKVNQVGFRYIYQ